MITEDYVSFETAKLLKKKGFDELCDKKYNGYKSIVPAGKMIELWQNSEFDDDGECSAPTLQMAMKWLREVYGLYIEVSLSCDREDKNAKIFDASIFNLQNQRYKKLGNIQGYEKTCEAAIKFCLKNLI